MHMKLAAIFKDGMVLQRNQINRIWGLADEGETITIEFLGQTYETRAQKGKWHIDLAPAKVGGAYEMTVTAGEERIVIRDILVGEVWFAGGQSNMEVELQNSDNGIQVAAQADYGWIRFYNVPKQPKVDKELEHLETMTRWKYARGNECLDVSAVAFYFAKKLYDILQVPVGIIDCYCGGTSATCWAPRESFAAVPEVQDYIKEWDDLIADKSEEQYQAELQEFNEKFDGWNNKVDMLKREKPDMEWPEINQIAGPCPWPPPMGGSAPFRPFGLYESMVKRVAPYGIRGFLYYQGEEDSCRAECYEKLNTCVIEKWREDFSLGEKENLPFLLTQLPMYIAEGEEDNRVFARIREQQSRVFANNENMGMAVLIDCGERDNVHPTDKKTPGERLALQALGRIYGKVERFDNLRVDKVTFIDDTAIVTFRNTYGEIRARVTDSSTLTALYEDNEVPAKILPPHMIWGFELSEDGVNFCPAQVTTVGLKLKLHAKGVHKPVAVRYGWTDFGVVNVYNGAGLPLEPFRAGE